MKSLKSFKFPVMMMRRMTYLTLLENPISDEEMEKEESANRPKDVQIPVVGTRAWCYSLFPWALCELTKHDVVYNFIALDISKSKSSLKNPNSKQNELVAFVGWSKVSV